LERTYGITGQIRSVATMPSDANTNPSDGMVQPPATSADSACTDVVTSPARNGTHARKTKSHTSGTRNTRGNRVPELPNRCVSTTPMPCTAPHAAKFQPAPCHSPLTTIVSIRLTYVP